MVDNSEWLEKHVSKTWTESTVKSLGSWVRLLMLSRVVGQGRRPSAESWPLSLAEPNQNVSCKNLKTNLMDIHNANVSFNTVFSRFHGKDMKSCYDLWKSLLSWVHKKARYQVMFCTQCCYWLKEAWRCFVYSDESRFVLSDTNFRTMQNCCQHGEEIIYGTVLPLKTLRWWEILMGPSIVHCIVKH